MSQNPFLLAADNSPAFLPLLRSNTSLAGSQDAHGYSLLHATASYNHLDLLRSLINEFHVDINLKDEDGETCLFVAETVDAAKCLVEELLIDTKVRNDEGQTAQEKLAADDEFPAVAEYLRLRDLTAGQGRTASAPTDATAQPPPQPAPTLPPNVRIDIGSVPEAQITGEGDTQEPDPEFKRRIEELAARGDFYDEVGQNQLRDLVTDAVKGVSADERDIRRRTS